MLQKLSIEITDAVQTQASLGYARTGNALGKQASSELR